MKLIFLFYVLFSIASTASDSIDILFNNGLKAFKNNEWDKAYDYFKKGCTLGDKDACKNAKASKSNLYFDKAYKAIQKDDWENAYEYYTKSCELGSKNACHRAKLSQGMLYFKKASKAFDKDDWENAYKYYTKSCELGDNAACKNAKISERSLYFDKAKKSYQNKDYENAYRYYIKSCELGSNNACKNAKISEKYLYFDKAKKSYQNKDYENAYEYYTKSCELGSKNACDSAKDMLKLQKNSLAMERNEINIQYLQIVAENEELANDSLDSVHKGYNDLEMIRASAIKAKELGLVKVSKELQILYTKKQALDKKEKDSPQKIETKVEKKVEEQKTHMQPSTPTIKKNTSPLFFREKFNENITLGDFLSSEKNVFKLKERGMKNPYEFRKIALKGTDNKVYYFPYTIGNKNGKTFYIIYLDSYYKKELGVNTNVSVTAIVSAYGNNEDQVEWKKSDELKAVKLLQEYHVEKQEAKRLLGDDNKYYKMYFKNSSMDKQVEGQCDLSKPRDFLKNLKSLCDQNESLRGQYSKRMQKKRPQEDFKYICKDVYSVSSALDKSSITKDDKYLYIDNHGIRIIMEEGYIKIDEL